MLQCKQSCFANHPVRQDADRVVYDFYQVARLQRRHRGAVAAEPDDIAGMKREIARHPGDVVGNAENHSAGVVARNSAAVEAHFDRLRHGIDPRDHAGPHRLEGVGIFCTPQCAVAALPSALAHVVAQRVACNASERFIFRNILCFLADERHELALEVDGSLRVLRDDDILAAADQGVGRAVADVGLLRNFIAHAVRLVRPFDMGAVVEPGSIEAANRIQPLPVDRDAAPLHSALTPEVLITCAQRSWSFLRNAANSPGLSAMVMAPSCFMRACVSGFASDLRISALTRLTIAAGVPAGASTPTQGAVASKPRRPIASMVGTPGKSGCGCAVPTARTLRRFCATWSAIPTIG